MAGRRSARTSGATRRPGACAWAPARRSSGRLEKRRLERILEGFARIQVLVVGDVVLDEYLRGEVTRVSPEAPVPVVHVQGGSAVLGGAGNVVRNVIALGAVARFATVVGDDGDGRQVRTLLGELGVDGEGLVVDPGRPTTRKTRVVAQGQQVVRLDREAHAPLAPGVLRRLLASVDALVPGCDVAVLEDYGKGVLARPGARRLLRRLAGMPVVVDPKGDLDAFRGATLVKPNLREAERLLGRRVGDEAGLARLGARLRQRLAGAELVVTRGEEGMTLFPDEGDPIHVPTLRQDVYDVQGAGDTSVVALALARCAGASLEEAALLANAAAGVVVAKSGTATASRAEVAARLPELLRVHRARGEGPR